MAHRLIRTLLMLCLLPVAGWAQIADPTRPPVLAVPDAAGGTAMPASGLQSIILRKGGRPAALINGEVVELGGKVGESRVVQINEDSVVLQGQEGRETLRLIPSVEKKQKVGAGGTAKPVGMNVSKGEPRK